MKTNRMLLTPPVNLVWKTEVSNKNKEQQQQLSFIRAELKFLGKYNNKKDTKM